MEYYPYGAPRLNEATSTSAFRTQKQYIGQYYDAPTSLSYLNARYYGGNKGNFISVDPSHLVVGDSARLQQLTGISQKTLLSDPQSLNSYSYARSNPITNKDPNGNFWQTAWPLLVDLFTPLHAGEVINTDGSISHPQGNGFTPLLIGSINPAGAAKNLVENVVKNESETAVKTLYHYTSEQGMKDILQSGKLNPSLKANNPKDAFYGDGQYLSDIVPGTKTGAQLSREFIKNPFQGNRFSNYIELDVSSLNLIKGRDGVYLNPSGNPLDISTLITSFGKNLK